MLIRIWITLFSSDYKNEFGYACWPMLIPPQGPWCLSMIWFHEHYSVEQKILCSYHRENLGSGCPFYWKIMSRCFGERGHVRKTLSTMEHCGIFSTLLGAVEEIRSSIHHIGLDATPRAQVMRYQSHAHELCLTVRHAWSLPLRWVRRYWWLLFAV